MFALLLPQFANAGRQLEVQALEKFNFPLGEGLHDLLLV
jgi:hypothetical protein